MEDIIINVSRETRAIEISKSTIGNGGENLQSKFIFKFKDEFVDGIARLEYEIKNQKYYAMLEKNEEEYSIPIKSVMTKEGQINMQLVITEEEGEEGIPIFKSNVFCIYCGQSINAQIEQPEQYETWIDMANQKLTEIEEKIEECDNLNVNAERVIDGVELNITKKDGTTKSVKVYDGQGGGTNNYENLDNKPKINGYELLGNKTSEELELNYDDTEIWDNIYDLNDRIGNAYESIEEVGHADNTYLFNATYTELDYPNARKYFDEHSEMVLGGCSAIVKDGALGRNYDWFYSNQAEFRISTNKTPNRYATTAIATIQGLDKDFIKMGEYSELYKYLPFSLLDGQNEKGLQGAILVVPNDKGETIGTPTEETREEFVIKINALMLIRYVLDNCANINEIKTALNKNVSIYIPQALRNLGYECHFIFKDNESVWALEFEYNECIWTDITEKPIMTNFFINGTTFKEDGSIYQIEESGIEHSGLSIHSQGLERYNILLAGLKNELMPINDILESVKYTQLYTKDWNDNPFISEYCGTENRIIIDDKIHFYDLYVRGQQEYARRNRNNPITDQTLHTSIYGDKLYVYTQENYNQEGKYEFPLALEKNTNVYRIECEDTTYIDGRIIPLITPQAFAKAILQDGAIVDNRILCISNIDAGDFYSINLSVLEGTDFVVSFMYGNEGILQYKTELKDDIEIKFIPFEKPNITGYYNVIEDKFYESMVFEDEIQPKDKTLFIDITDINHPATYICFVNGSNYTYRKTTTSVMVYIGSDGARYETEETFPIIEKNTLQEIYDNEKHGIEQTLYWINKNNIDKYFKVLSFSENNIGSIITYNIEILLDGAYICKYIWTTIDEGHVEPIVFEIATKNYVDNAIARALANL